MIHVSRRHGTRMRASTEYWLRRTKEENAGGKVVRFANEPQCRRKCNEIEVASYQCGQKQPTLREKMFALSNGVFLQWNRLAGQTNLQFRYVPKDPG